MSSDSEVRVISFDPANEIHEVIKNLERSLRNIGSLDVNLLNGSAGSGLTHSYKEFPDGKKYLMTVLGNGDSFIITDSGEDPEPIALDATRFRKVWRTAKNGRTELVKRRVATYG